MVETTMKTELTITTLRGGQINLSTEGYDIHASVEIKGETHGFSGVQIKNNSRFGDYLEFGPVTAPVSPETIKQIESVLFPVIRAKRAALKVKYDAEKAVFLASPEGKSWLLGKKMDRANSDL